MRARRKPALTRAKHRGRRQGKARIRKQKPKARQAWRGAQYLPHPFHAGGAATDTNRHIRAKLRANGGQARFRQTKAPKPIKRAQAGRRIGTAAANAACDRQSLQQVQQRMAFNPRRLSQGARRAQHKVVRLRRQRRAFRAFNGKGQDLPRTGADCIAHAGKHNQAIQQMIPIRPAPRDMQEKIDLGRGRFEGFQRRLSAAG